MEASNPPHVFSRRRSAAYWGISFFSSRLLWLHCISDLKFTWISHNYDLDFQWTFFNGTKDDCVCMRVCDCVSFALCTFTLRFLVHFPLSWSLSRRRRRERRTRERRRSQRVKGWRRKIISFFKLVFCSPFGNIVIFYWQNGRYNMSLAHLIFYLLIHLINVLLVLLRNKEPLQLQTRSQLSSIHWELPWCTNT